MVESEITCRANGIKLEKLFTLITGECSRWYDLRKQFNHTRLKMRVRRLINGWFLLWNPLSENAVKSHSIDGFKDALNASQATVYPGLK